MDWMDRLWVWLCFLLIFGGFYVLAKNADNKFRAMQQRQDDLEWEQQQAKEHIQVLERWSVRVDARCECVIQEVEEK